MHKDKNFIRFPQILRTTTCFGKQFDYYYDLKSVVEHLGGANSGHFLTMRKLPWGSHTGCQDLDHSPSHGQDVDESRSSAFKKLLEGQNEFIDYPINHDNPGTWVLANDSSISFVPLKDVLNSSAYMLFYERQD
eukprot:CAMPEP_0168331850 /NCGR_PEP_ID=MMETSP0213-20121227/8586_1 /TAXON_ID=151035 /ORGANISM="Euplotes harpa, Strain FSP1.4" /LENGTH=133 /DNA_ID=CAMNT_0008335719 /DNA_START=1359 /DNA_END=1760 /DNA_ORIENTATION=-